MNAKVAFQDCTQRLKLLISKNPQLITVTLSNIFTMRLVGNKTHGDLAEIAIAEFINQYMYDFKSLHVGKDLFRAKQSEEDIQIVNEITKDKFSVSLKAYGDGPLQLSTDKRSLMFETLRNFGHEIADKLTLETMLEHPAFANFSDINILPLIYDERRGRCNILVFDYERAKTQIARIVYLAEGHGRKHPVYRFQDREGDYICEVRYGGATANALQRRLWTHTRNGAKYFDSLTGGWISYSLNSVLVKLFSHALLASAAAHEAVLSELQKDLEAQKRGANLA